MRIDKIRTIAGPNIYTYKPVLVARLFLEELTDVASTEIPGFIDRLLALLPGIHEHRCSRGRPGGFVERLHEGTYFAHIVEHVALELTEHAGIPSYFGRARYGGEPGCYNVVIEYKAEQGARFLLNVAVELVTALVAGEPYPLEEKIKEANRIVGETELGPSTRAIVDAATWRGIPWFRIGTEGGCVARITLRRKESPRSFILSSYPEQAFDKLRLPNRVPAIQSFDLSLPHHVH